MTLTKDIDNYFNNIITHQFCAVMLFDTSLNQGINNIPDNWINYNNAFFHNGTDALAAYISADSPAKELITANSKDELLFQMLLTIDNYNNPQWKSQNLYPYL